MEADLVYFRRRAVQERAAAAAAGKGHVRNVHLELAAAYDRKIADLEARSASIPLHLVSAA
jgi:hypothetical protein